jgi:ABC-type glycerol-3-phosphate transport system substrate-binding protein
LKRGLALLIAVALSAWAARAATPLPAPAGKLVVWMVGDDRTPQLLQPAVQAFRAEHPGVEVEVRDVPWADAMTKYSAALASQRGPDLITGSTSYGIDLGAKGALVDLNQRAPDLVHLLEQHANPGALRAVRRPDGTMHAAPFDMHVQMQFHRTDLLPSAPATWDEFMVAARGLRARGTRGFAQQWGNTSWLGYYPYLRQAGGAVYDEACSKTLLDSPQAVKALTYYAALYRELQAPTDSWPDADGGLESGAYPLIQSGSWQLSQLDVMHRQVAGKWAAAPLPAGPTGRRTALLGGTVLGVTAFSPRIELALAFMRTVYRADVARTMADSALQAGLMWLPAGRQDQLAALPMPAARKQALLAQLQDAEGPPNCPGWLRHEYIVTRAVQRVVLAGGDPATELRQAAMVLNRTLAVHRTGPNP